MTAIARTAQVALLPSVPPEITGISIAVRYRSATPDASVGGNLYEIIPTGHGIRMIIGDVRGHGLDAVLVARHVLSAFRRNAVALPALEHVAGEISRTIKPHLGEDDFVTAVLAQAGERWAAATDRRSWAPPRPPGGPGRSSRAGSCSASVGPRAVLVVMT
jgi:phosphoserine phosphatase RsbU/P